MIGAPELTFSESDHAYCLGDRRLISVTQACSLLTDFSAIPADVLETKALIGRAVHDACQFFDDGTLDRETVDPSIAGYVRAWAQFKAESGFTVIRNEEIVCHPALGYAGRLDRVGRFEGKNWKMYQEWILEIKTSAPQGWHGVQMAAYASALSLEVVPDHGLPYRRIGVYLRPDGSYTTKEYQSRDDWKLFQACLAVCQARESYRKPELTRPTRLFSRGHRKGE